jgi:uncharacterized protein (TIGR00251 family)
VIEQRGAAVRITVRAQPRASRTEVAGAHGDAVRIRVAAPPVDGEANRELTKFIAKRVGVPASTVHVITGDSGRNKIVEIERADAVDVRRALLG